MSSAPTIRTLTLNPAVDEAIAATMESPEPPVRPAATTGAATAMTRGTQLCDPHEVERPLGVVVVRKLEPLFRGAPHERPPEKR